MAVTTSMAGAINYTVVTELKTAHKYAKLAYEQMGYEVIIDLA